MGGDEQTHAWTRAPRVLGQQKSQQRNSGRQHAQEKKKKQLELNTYGVSSWNVVRL